MVKRAVANQTSTTSLKRTIESFKCEMSKQENTVGRKLAKFEGEIQSANQSLGDATKVIVAQRGQLATSNRTIQVQQQRLFMLQHMSNATAPTTQKSFCVLM